MANIEFLNTSIDGLLLINSFSMEDNRGYFLKDFEKEIFAQKGLDIDFYETFESFSWKNVLRGLHFQINEPQAKLVRAITGEIYDVVVDLRLNSRTFGKWEGFRLSCENRKSLFVPKGFAHGFCVRSDSAIVSYKCVGKYLKGSDSGIIWNDETLLIDWGIKKPIISGRDSTFIRFDEFIKEYHGLG